MGSDTDPGSAQTITPHPTDDPKARIETMLAARPEQRGRDAVYFSGFVEDGISSYVVLTPMDPKAKSVQFDTYYLRKSVYEKAAEEGGFENGLVWVPTTIPDGFEESLGDKTEDAWDTYVTASPMAIAVAF